MILNFEEKTKELYKLLNSFELCYPIIIKNIEKYNIEEIKDKAYLAWYAGGIYFSEEFEFSKSVFVDYFFEKIFESFNITNLSEKGILFAFFSLGAVISVNNFEEARILLKDYYKIIASGIVLIQKVKFDFFEDGKKKWSIETIKKYSSFDDEDELEDFNPVKEFKKIINDSEKNKDDIKILN